MANATLYMPLTQRDYHRAALLSLAELCMSPPRVKTHPRKSEIGNAASILRQCVLAYDSAAGRPNLEPAMWTTCLMAERRLRALILSPGAGLAPRS